MRQAAQTGDFQTALRDEDIQPEQVILGVTMYDPGLLASIRAIVKCDDFVRPDHQRLWVELCRRADIGEPLEAADLAPWLKSTGHASPVLFVSALMDAVPAVTTAEYYARKVAEAGRLRRTAYALHEATQAALRRDPDALDRLLREAVSASEGRVVARGRTATVASRDYLALRRRIADGEKLTLKIGQPLLDDHLNAEFGGGFMFGQVVYFAGRAKGGKSTLIADVLRRTLARHPDLSAEMYSLEMTDWSVCGKFLRAESAEFDNIPGFRTIPISALERALAVVERTYGERLEIVDNPGLSPDDVMSAASRATRRGVHVFVLDHLTLVSYAGRPEHLRHEVTALCKRLHNHAKTTQSLWFVACQLNRAAEGVEPTMANLRESGGIEENAHAVLGIWRKQGMRGHEVDALYLCNRFGPAERARLHVSWRHQTFGGGPV